MNCPECNQAIVTDPTERILLSVPQVAAVLGLGTTLTWQLVSQGSIPSIRVGRLVRVPRAALQAWLDDQADQAYPRAQGAKVRRGARQ